jgi:transposase-like protein
MTWPIGTTEAAYKSIYNQLWYVEMKYKKGDRILHEMLTVPTPREPASLSLQEIQTIQKDACFWARYLRRDTLPYVGQAVYPQFIQETFDILSIIVPDDPLEPIDPLWWARTWEDLHVADRLEAHRDLFRKATERINRASHPTQQEIVDAIAQKLGSFSDNTFRKLRRQARLEEPRPDGSGAQRTYSPLELARLREATLCSNVRCRLKIAEVLDELRLKAFERERDLRTTPE